MEANQFVPIVYPDAARVKASDPKVLTPKHKQILSLVAQGMKYQEIGSLCKCTPARIVQLVASPLGQQYLSYIEQQMDMRLRALFSKSIDAIEDQLTAGSGENKLRAAKLQMQATGKLREIGEKADTAEDVIQRIMEMNVAGDVNIQINNAPQRGTSEE